MNRRRFLRSTIAAAAIAWGASAGLLPKVPAVVEDAQTSESGVVQGCAVSKDWTIRIIQRLRVEPGGWRSVRTYAVVDGEEFDLTEHGGRLEGIMAGALKDRTPMVTHGYVR